VNCPDIDRLIDLGLGDSEDSELQAHLRDCPGCRADLLTIRALAGVGADEKEISEELLSSIISSLPQPVSETKLKWSRGLQMTISWSLGSLTGLAATVVTGSIGTTNLNSVLLAAAAFGCFCVLAPILGSGDYTSTTENPL
jgi:hypothetical protein